MSKNTLPEADTPRAASTMVFDPCFSPRAPWFGGDLQTMASVLSPPRVSLDDLDVEALRLPTLDGSGDILTGERLTLPGTADSAGLARPTVVLLHGMMGDLDRGYMRVLTHTFARLGHAVVRMNLRGAGSSRPLCRRNYHAGFTTDLHAMAAALSARSDTGKLAWIGISLSGNMLLKAASETDFVDAADHHRIVSVSAPIDLIATSERFSRKRNFIYKAYLVRKIRRLGPLQPGRTPTEIAQLRRIRSVGELDECFTAPDNGYASASEYYQLNSAKEFIPDARLPCLVISSADDPWIDIGPYQAIKWHLNPLLTPVLTRTGGHVGFHGRGYRDPMYVGWSRAFLD